MGLLQSKPFRRLRELERMIKAAFDELAKLDPHRSPYDPAEVAAYQAWDDHVCQLMDEQDIVLRICCACRRCRQNTLQCCGVLAAVAPTLVEQLRHINVRSLPDPADS